MNKPKAELILANVSALKSLGHDPEVAPGRIESRHPFDVRLNATTSEGKPPRQWTIRVTANWDGVDWRELFDQVEEIDKADGTRCRYRIQNGGIELT